MAAASAMMALGLRVAGLNPVTMARAALGVMPAPDNPVVVELFTSQGCSSCPPADRLISKLGRPNWRGRLIPLAFHVDYWDRLGWRDPFSSAKWTMRQEEYAHAFGLNGTYTPQIVVGGARECVGSDQSRVLAAIEQEGGAPEAVRIAIAPESPGSGRKELRIKINALAAADTKRDQQLVAAVFESGLKTKIGAGERDGETLINDFTVRELVPVFELGHRAGAQRSVQVAIPIEAGWNMDQIGVAVFAQDPVTLKIDGAAITPLRDSDPSAATKSAS
jgi:hypothetical protein